MLLQPSKELLSDEVRFADKEEQDEVSDTTVLGMVWNAGDDFLLHFQIQIAS